VIQLVSGAQEAGGFDLFGEPVVVETPPLDELESGWIRVVRPRMKSRRIGVEEIRNLEQTLHLAAPGGACKVGVITEADRMNDQAANAFLKTLEEPPQKHPAPPAHRQSPAPAAHHPLALRATAAAGRACAAFRTAARNSSPRSTTPRPADFGTPVAALHLKATFAAFLARSARPPMPPPRRRKGGNRRLPDATDGTWLKAARPSTRPPPRPNTSTPATASSTCCMAWMADLLRMKVKSGGLDFPDSAPALRRIAEAEPETRLLQRMAGARLAAPHAGNQRLRAARHRGRLSQGLRLSGR
jgi:DNA polymerase III subunit delta'